MIRVPDARSTRAAADVAARIDWVEADLGTWTPQRSEYDLVVCLYVHAAGSVEEMVQRPGQLQVSVEAALAALDPGQWQPIVMSVRGRQPVPASMP